MSQQIKLKATLRAYSKSPFYTDFVRDIYSQENVTPKTQYVRVYNESFDSNGQPISGNYTGEWVALDTTLLQKPLKEFEAQVAAFGKSLKAIDVSVDFQSNRLKFTDGDGIVEYFELPSANIDYKTITINDSNKLCVVDTPDENTLKEVDVIYEYMDENGNPLPNEYGIVIKKSGKLRVSGIYVDNIQKSISGNELNSRLSSAEKNLRDLENYIQGTGGFLDPYNFEKSLSKLSEEDRNMTLNIYTYLQLYDGIPQEIPDQTKVKNLYDGHIWVYIQSKNIWVDEGADTIVQANNEGVLGVVAGSKEKFKASINADGTISINNLQEELNNVMYDTNASVEPEPNTYVKRSINGQIKVEDPIEANDAVNLKYIETFYASHRITEEQINSLFGRSNN